MLPEGPCRVHFCICGSIHVDECAQGGAPSNHRGSGRHSRDRFRGGCDRGNRGQALANAARRAGIDKPVRPHGLRHTLAAELARQGVGLPAIQAQLGFASLDSTAHYLVTIAPNVVKVMANLPPWLGEDRR